MKIRTTDRTKKIYTRKSRPRIGPKKSGPGNLSGPVGGFGQDQASMHKDHIPILELSDSKLILSYNLSRNFPLIEVQKAIFCCEIAQGEL